MKRTDISSLGRPLDSEYPTNRAIGLVTLLVTIAGLIWQRLSGVPWLDSALWGAQAGLTGFLTWALCRELDPDHPVAALPAAGMALAALLARGLPELAVILWLLVLSRVVNRTTGLPAGVLDVLGLMGLTGWLSLQGNWGYGVITVVAFLLDSQLPDPARRQLLFALLSAIITAGAATLGEGLPREAPSLMGGLIALGLSLLLLPVVLAAGSVDSVGDETGERLTPVRVQAAQVLALLAGVESAFAGGPNALVALSPLWAAVLGAFLTWTYHSLTRGGSRS